MHNAHERWHIGAGRRAQQPGHGGQKLRGRVGAAAGRAAAILAVVFALPLAEGRRRAGAIVQAQSGLQGEVAGQQLGGGGFLGVFLVVFGVQFRAGVGAERAGGLRGRSRHAPEQASCPADVRRRGMTWAHAPVTYMRRYRGGGPARALAPWHGPPLDPRSTLG